MSIILGLSSALSIIISAAVSIIYTFLGGLYSVAFTDVIQLAFIFVSLVRNKGSTERGEIQREYSKVVSDRNGRKEGGVWRESHRNNVYDKYIHDEG